LISASAGPAGISGTVEINSPTVDVAGSLATLPESPLDATAQMQDACGARAPDAGSFAVLGRDGCRRGRTGGWEQRPWMLLRLLACSPFGAQALEGARSASWKRERT
jgi:hypothetical protein